jgi:hypothetical protein
MLVYFPVKGGETLWQGYPSKVKFFRNVENPALVHTCGWVVLDLRNVIPVHLPLRMVLE